MIVWDEYDLQKSKKGEACGLPPSSRLISGLEVSCEASSSLAVSISLSAPQLSK